ncbi:MAG TPA: hypothetical protein VHU17_06390 [Acidimicrobiales bacterium]|jgi:hypothetical protein|nr:hypothetical protein [Acidimicrobiales bacterium]
MSGTDPPVTTSRGDRRGITRWVRGHIGLVVLLAAPVVVFGIPLLFGQVFLDGDNFIQNYPLRVLVGQDLIHGHLPLLNPYIFSGTPLLGGFNAGGAYPPTWLFAILPAELAWTLNLIAAYEVAAVGMYLFLRRQTVSAAAASFGAAAFSFGGFFGGQIVHIDLISGTAWLPWMLLGVHGLTESKGASPSTGPGSVATPRWWWALLLAAATALTILAGAPESVLDAALVVLIYLIWRYWRYWRSGSWDASGRRSPLAPLGYLAVSVGVGLAASAAQWLPGLVFTAQSQRATPTYQFFASGSLPWRLTALVFSPFVLGTNQYELSSYFGTYNLPEVTSYVGILALIAACALLTRRWRRRPEASRWWIWYVVLVLSLIAAWGGNTPFGHVLFLIPGIKSERLLNRSLLGVDFALAALLAWWVHMVLADRARARSGGGGREAARTETSGSAPPRTRSRGVEVAVTCIPIVVVTVLCVGSWLWSNGLEQFIGTQYPSTSSMRLAVAAVLTGGVVIAAAATWIALFPGRLTPTVLRRALALVMAVDLVFFTALILHGPVTQTTARATGPTGDRLTAVTGNGRFIVYDPDRFVQGELFALGQTDLNVAKQLPSAQGYAALVDGNYYRATGAHLQEDLDPYTLAGSTWDDLNVTVLLSLPSYFVTPVPSASPTHRATPFPPDPNTFTGGPLVSAGPIRLAAGGRHTWYFGSTLTLTSGVIPVDGGAVGPAARIGLITPMGSVAWLAKSAPADHGGAGAALRFSLDAPTVAAGIVVQNGAGKPLTAATPEVDTVEDGTVALDGRLQTAVIPPHWTFTGTIGSFGVFRNSRPHGWAWTTARNAGDHPGRVRQLSAGRDGTQRFLVRAPNPVWLVRSEAPAPGWHATVQAVDATGSRPRGSATSAPVVSLKVTQRVKVPAGDFVVTFRYAPVSTLTGLGVSAVGGLSLVVGGMFVLVGWRRRRDGRGAPHVAAPPVRTD